MNVSLLLLLLLCCLLAGLWTCGKTCISCDKLSVHAEFYSYVKTTYRNSKFSLVIPQKVVWKQNKGHVYGVEVMVLYNEEKRMTQLKKE